MCTNLNNELYACGLLSSAFLKKVKNKNDVYCKKGNKDRYGRLIAICYANEINLNQLWLNKVGLWRIDFTLMIISMKRIMQKKIKEVYGVVVL